MAIDTSTLREGDRVKMIPPSGYAGKTGTVRHEAQTGTLAIFTDDGSRIAIDPSINAVTVKMSAPARRLVERIAAIIDPL